MIDRDTGTKRHRSHRGKERREELISLFLETEKTTKYIATNIPLSETERQRQRRNILLLISLFQRQRQRGNILLLISLFQRQKDRDNDEIYCYYVISLFHCGCVIIKLEKVCLSKLLLQSSIQREWFRQLHSKGGGQNLFVKCKIKNIISLFMLPSNQTKYFHLVKSLITSPILQLGNI